jgi:hypothetical protein
MWNTKGIMKIMTHTVIGMIVETTIIGITIAMNMIVMIMMDVDGKSLQQMRSTATLTKKPAAAGFFYD